MDNGDNPLNLNEVTSFGYAATTNSTAPILVWIGTWYSYNIFPSLLGFSKIIEHSTLATAGGVALGILLLITSCLALFFCKRRRARNVVVKEDINDTYSNYYADPDAVTEMTDNNDYYAGGNDYEAGTTETRDVNSKYQN